MPLGDDRGRQRMKYMDGIEEMVGKENMEEVVKLARNRRVWHSVVANITRHGTAVSGNILLVMSKIVQNMSSMRNY